MKFLSEPAIQALTTEELKKYGTTLLVFIANNSNTKTAEKLFDLVTKEIKSRK